ncbi:hypothetical protein K474DRAFT_153145 [Panus rudis PR-1116 ss-1]|nr:hypothetical protein K474DRAFT_153145 [Panus rudis PR-1116 ss-1]
MHLGSSPSEENTSKRISANSTLVTCLRDALSKAPIGSKLFSSQSHSVLDAQDVLNPVISDYDNFTSEKADVADSGWRRNSSNFSLSDVKRCIKTIAGGTLRTRSRSSSCASLSPTTSPKPVFQAFIKRPRAHTVSFVQPSVSESTPPLTPDSLMSPSGSFNSGEIRSDIMDCAFRQVGPTFDQDDDKPRNRQDSERIKNEKRPEHPICLTVLPNSPAGSPAPETPEQPYTNDAGDDSEWFGLEYTLELSRMEDYTSPSESFGEYSKSPQSWIAMHRGWIHPNYEVTEYEQWRKWHRTLENLEERRRIERTFSFLRYSKRQAEVYVRAMRLQGRSNALRQTGLDVREVRTELLKLSYRPIPLETCITSQTSLRRAKSSLV